MSNLNWVDLIILAFFFLSIIAGMGRGFIGEVVSLLTWIMAFIVAITFTYPLASAFTSSSSVQGIVTQASSAIGMSASQPVSYLALVICFLILFAGTILAGSLLGYFLNFAFQVGTLGIGNRLLGGIFGFARGFIINLVLIFLVQLTPFNKASWWQQSQFVASFQPTVQWLDGIISPNLGNLKAKIAQEFQKVTSTIQNMTR